MNLALNPSRYLVVVLVMLHTLAITVTFMMTFSLILKLILVLICSYSLWIVVRKYGLLISKNTIISITEQENGIWLLTDKSHRLWEGKLHHSSLNTTFLIILNFIIEGKRLGFSIPIVKDALSSDQFRRLSVRLRCQ